MTIGEHLRTSREAKGLSLDALAQTTRVQPRILAAIERNDVTSVPPRPFGRGFVRAYAKEIGLDPERTANDYFAQFAPSPAVCFQEAPLPSSGRVVSMPGWFAVGALALLVVVLGALALRRPDPGSGVEAAAAIGTTGQSAEITPVSDTHEQSAARDIALSAVAPPNALSVELTATRRCWVSASADGRRVVYRLLPTGATETLRAEREIRILAGDAGALEWSINGRKAGVFGGSGQIRTARVTPDTAPATR